MSFLREVYHCNTLNKCGTKAAQLIGIRKYRKGLMPQSMHDYFTAFMSDSDTAVSFTRCNDRS